MTIVLILEAAGFGFPPAYPSASDLARDHKLIADAVFQAIGSGGAGDLTASAGASWTRATAASR